MSTVLVTRYDIWDLNNGKVSAYPVAKPPGWDDISLYYAKALQKMGWLDPGPNPGTDVSKTWSYSTQPNSYYFQGSMHWNPLPEAKLPAGWQNWWNHCTHATGDNYFLAWHRNYIYWFEVLVRAVVQELKGPDGWGIPYWNYSYSVGSTRPVPWPRACLPWVFCQPKLPDGTNNPLYMPDTARRGFQPTLPGSHPPKTMYLPRSTPSYSQAWAASVFTGGSVDFNESLENLPHNAVHGDLGTGNGRLSRTGWMADPATAGFDPIFWLPHSEIDRFWVGWNAAGHPNPTDQTFLNATDDPERTTRWNFWQDGNLKNVVVVYPGDLMDPQKLPSKFPHTYTYANLPPAPSAARPAVAAALAATRPAAAATTGAPRAAAAASGGDLGTTQNVQLGKQAVSATVEMTEEAGAITERVAAGTGPSPRIILTLEGILADGPPHNYEIYLNTPGGDPGTTEVPHFVGILGAFGANHRHGDHAHGLTMRYDITDIVQYLKQSGGWDPAKATVTFVPTALREPGEELTFSDVRVSSISIRAVDEH